MEGWTLESWVQTNQHAIINSFLLKSSSILWAYFVFNRRSIGRYRCIGEGTACPSIPCGHSSRSGKNRGGKKCEGRKSQVCKEKYALGGYWSHQPRFRWSQGSPTMPWFSLFASSSQKVIRMCELWRRFLLVSQSNEISLLIGDVERRREKTTKSCTRKEDQIEQFKLCHKSVA